MAFGLAVYASPPGLPQPTQDSLPAVGQTLLGGLLPAGFQRKVSECFVTSHPPSPSFAWRKHIDRSRWEAPSPPGHALSLWHPRPVDGYVVALRRSSLTARPLGCGRDHPRRAGGLAIPGSLLLGLLPAVARHAGRVRLPRSLPPTSARTI